MTTRRLSAAICIAVFALGAIAATTSLAFHPERGDAFPAPARDGTSKAPAIGAAFEVKIKPSAVDALTSLPIEERADQWRDWGVYGTVSRDAAPDVVAKATYQMAPLRLPYLRDLYIFDYGWARRVYVGNRSLVFYDDATPDVSAVIGRIADQIRMESGHKPASVEVYALHIEQDYGRIGVVRKPDLAEQDLFGPAFGYVERDVTDAKGLDELLAHIDDVSYVAVGDRSNVVVGGRQFPSTRTKNVTGEDVAALYQAASKVSEAERAHEAQANRIFDEVNEEYRRAQILGDRSSATQALYQRKAHERMEALQSKRLHPPGFSLDPQWKLDHLADHLGQLVANPCATLNALRRTVVRGMDRDQDNSARPITSWAGRGVLLATALAGDKACLGISAKYGQQLEQVLADVRAATKDDWQFKLASYYKLVAELGQQFNSLSSVTSNADNSAATVLSAALEYFQAADQLQCARYDGPPRGEQGTLQGTAVGMNLFYTDLLAKLYILDYHHSTPVDYIPGMLSGPTTPDYAMFAKEARERPNTRLWFGPRVDAVAKLSGDALAFRHIATRVYAAGSNPVDPGKEALPGEWARLNLSWWDRHYEAIADYESQYHVQNQIMKWSVIASQMADHRIDFLATVPVSRSHQFDNWLAMNHDTLRYQYDIPLRPEGDWITGTECLDLFQSYPSPSGSVLSGGVSLASPKSLRALTPVTEAEELGFRFHPTQELAGEAGTAARRWPTYVAKESTVPIDRRLTPTRFEGTDLQLGTKARVNVTVQPNEIQFRVSGDNAEVGRLGVQSRGGNAEIGWDAGHTEAARQAVLKAAAPKSTPAELAGGARSPIRFADSERVVVPGDEPGRTLAIEPTSLDAPNADYLAATANGTKQLHVQSLADSAFHKQLDAYEWQRITVPTEQARFDVPAALERQFGRGPPPAEARAVSLTGEYGKLDGFITHDGELWIRRPQAEPAIKAWHQLDVDSNLTPSKLRGLAQSADHTFDINAHGVPRVAEALAADDSRAAVLAIDPELLDNPASAAKAVADSASSAVSTSQLRMAITQQAAARSLAQAMRNFMQSDSKTLMHDLVNDLVADLPDIKVAHIDRLLHERVSAPLDVIDDFARGTRRLGSPEIGDLVEAQAGRHAMAPDVIAELTPVMTRDKLIGLRYRFPDAKRSVVSGRDAIRAKLERATHGDGSYAVYVDDRIQLGREGVEHGTSPQISDWIDSDNVQWEEHTSIGTYPAYVEQENVQFRRVAFGIAAPRHGGHILMLRQCGAHPGKGSADSNAGSGDQQSRGC